jgi:hypothetical protein
MLCRTTSNAKPHGDGAKSLASEGPLKPNWPTYTTTTTDREGRPLPTFTRASRTWLLLTFHMQLRKHTELSM